MSEHGSASVSLVGDVMFQTPFARNPHAQSAPFKAAVTAMREADLVVVNLEMPLSTRGYRVPKHANLRSDPAIINDVRDMGVHAVALANNHMMDYGQPALFDTLAACESAGLATCGAGADLDAADRPAWLEANGRRIALLSVACTLPVESDAGPGKPGIAPIRVGFSFEVDPNLLVEQPGTMPVVRSWAVAEDQDRVCRQLATLKEEADAVIVAIHWGVPSYWLSPYQGLLAEYQQPLGRALIDAGADIIWGHHSHSLHPVEVYKGKPIFYSLGNFIFESPRGFMEPESVIVQATFGDELAIELVPLWIDEGGFPHRVTGEMAKQVFDKLAGMSQAFGTELRFDGDRARLVLG